MLAFSGCDGPVTDPTVRADRPAPSRAHRHRDDARPTRARASRGSSRGDRDRRVRGARRRTSRSPSAGRATITSRGKVVGTYPSQCTVGDQIFYNAEANTLAAGHGFVEPLWPVTHPGEKPPPAADHPPLTVVVLGGRQLAGRAPAAVVDRGRSASTRTCARTATRWRCSARCSCSSSACSAGASGARCRASTPTRWGSSRPASPRCRRTSG